MFSHGSKIGPSLQFQATSRKTKAATSQSQSHASLARASPLTVLKLFAQACNDAHEQWYEWVKRWYEWPHSDRNSLKSMTLELVHVLTAAHIKSNRLNDSLIFKAVSLETLVVSTAEARSRCSDMSSEMLQTHENHEIPKPVKLGSREIPV